MAATVKLAEYLFTRLRQLGVQSVHGIPGDYNLTLLDYVEPNLHWIGNCNELNAGYATDAYSRVKGIGALITTFGVGELSAANAIAGAYAELAPVVHIVGTPTRQQQKSRALIHHTLNDGNYRRFALMAEQITVAQVRLEDPRDCPEQIDWALKQCLTHSRPVYIEVPNDMVAVPVAAERLQSELRVQYEMPAGHATEAITAVLDLLYKSQRPMILVDGECRGYQILDEVRDLINKTKWPTFTTLFSKSLIDETLSNFRGIWQGSLASAEDQEFVKSRDLILCLGPHFSGTNSYFYSSIPDPSISVLMSSTVVKTPTKEFRDMIAKSFLATLLKKLDLSKIAKPSSSSSLSTQVSLASDLRPGDLITQADFYRTFSQTIRSGDIILAETGTPGYGCRDFRLPPHTHLLKPTTWLSIGYMLPATQGASLAQRELHSAGKWQQDNPDSIPRTILLIGDGSFQMTAQELSTIIREKLNVLIILINNNGYTIERCIHGWNQVYNDVAQWQYLKAPALFGASEDDNAEYSASTATVRTWGDLDKVMEMESKVTKPSLRMVEVFMDKEDAPTILLNMLNKQKQAAKQDATA